MKTILKKTLGVILVIYGIFALLTPFTPGSWLAIIGMELLGIHLVVFDRFLPEKQRVALRRFMSKFQKGAKVHFDNSADNLQGGFSSVQAENKSEVAQDNNKTVQKTKTV